MAISENITKQNIFDAIKYIKENGVPDHYNNEKYDLVDALGEKYPPKYIIAVANHLVNNTDISTDTFNAVEAKNFLNGLNFKIEAKQEKYELIITADNVKSTDERFSKDNLGLGDGYKPLDTYFK